MDLHPLTADDLEFLDAPVVADRDHAMMVREVLETGFIGSGENERLEALTTQQLGPNSWAHYHSELPGCGVQFLVEEVGVSPLAASGAQVQRLLYEWLPAQGWFDGYELEDLMSFEAFWRWMARVLPRPSLEEGHRACARALGEFMAGGSALPGRVRAAG